MMKSVCDADVHVAVAVNAIGDKVGILAYFTILLCLLVFSPPIVFLLTQGVYN